MSKGIDRHPTQIVATLHVRGITLLLLAIENGYANCTTLSYVLRRRWPKGERIIAQALDLHPAEIWPSRYQGGSRGKKV